MMPNPKLKVAYGSIPKDCGTFTFYRNLKKGLLTHGIELYCVATGAQEAGCWQEAFADENCLLLAAKETDRKEQARAFVDWSLQEKIDIVMPINSVALLSAIPHLPNDCKVVMRCANAFDHGYRITVTCYERLARIVATTPRHVTDLTSSYGVAPEKLTLIPHGIDPGPFASVPARPLGDTRKLSIGFLGRIEHNQKGVLYLPGIVKSLRQQGVEFQLKIAGAGEDQSRLEGLLAEAVADGSVQFVGRMTPQQVPDFLGSIDLFLFPSRFEGFGFSLVEAMMAGCVPVASRIPGITDFIIEHERTGWLCPVGDAAEFAKAIAHLDRDRAALKAAGAAAASTAIERFNLQRMAQQYASLFEEVAASPLSIPAPRPWSDFCVDAAFRKTWRDVCPKPIKRFIRALKQAPVLAGT